MPVTRRALLTTGAASIVLIGTGAAGYIFTRSVEPAREPWRAASQGFGDPRLDALAYAILAPNPHNRQPWQIRLEGRDAMTLSCDLDRLLPETDPSNRQITIGLGAFLELLRQATAEKGYRAVIDRFPEGEPQPVLDARPIAHIRLVRDADVKRDPLFGAALERRTVRVPYTDQPVDPAMLERIAASARLDAAKTGFGWTLKPDDLAWFKALDRDGWRIEAETKRTHEESMRLTRIGAAEVNANPDGISLAGPFFESMRLAGLLSRDAMREQGSQAWQAGIDFYNGLIDSAMGFGWLTTPGNSRLDQLNAGAAWVRLHLAATQAGLAMHPLSQVLQEFPEMAEPFRRIHERVGIAASGRVQGHFRFGHAPAQPPSPRWPLRSRLIAA